MAGAQPKESGPVAGRMTVRVRKDGAEVAEIEQVYRQRALAFERVAIAIAGDDGLGLDAVSEAFSRALKARHQFRRDAPLDAWLWRIVINEAKRVATSREVPTEEVDERLPAPDISPDDRSLVRARIAALPEQQRNALFLRYYADLDYAGIAAALGVAPGTVAAALHAAHRRLADELQEVRQWKRSIR